MIALPLGDELFLPLLQASMRASADAHVIWCASTGECRGINGPACTLLGSLPGTQPSRDDALRYLAPRLVGLEEGELQALLGMTPRRPLQRAMVHWHGTTPETDAWLEWTSLWVHSPEGGLLLVRARRVHAEALAWLGAGPDAACRQGLLDADQQALSLLVVDRQHGECSLRFSDESFSQAFGLVDGRPLSVSDWTGAGLCPFDAAAVMAAVASRQPGSFLVTRSHAPGTPRSGGRDWQLQVSPRPAPGGDREAVSLLLWHPLDAAPAPIPSLPRRSEAGRDFLLQCRNDGRLAYVGEGWLQLTGHRVAAALGKPLTDFCHPAARANCDDLLRPVLQGEQQACRHELPFLTADGHLRWLELRLWQEQTTPGLCDGSLVDITERFTRQRLRHIQELALENTVNGVVITDNLQPGNPIVYVNKAWPRLTGYCPEETLGRYCSMLQGSDRAQPGIELMREAIRASRSASAVFRNYRKDGSMFWNQVDISPIREPLTGLVTHYFGLQTDVTATKVAAEANLRRAQELERLFRSSPLGMLAVAAQSRITVMTPAFERMTGLHAETWLGRSLSDLTLALQTMAAPDAGQLYWPKPGQVAQWKVQRPCRCVLEASASDITDGDLERVFFLRDVTAETDLSQMKTQFLATAAHELRAPMGSIRGFTELLLMRPFSAEQTREMLETVLRQSVRLNTLLSDLLDLSKLEAQGPSAFILSAVPLQDVIQRAMGVVVLPGDVRQVRCIWPSDGVVPAVWAHAGKLEQVLINLLSNACKYSPAGAPVELRVAADPPGQSGWLSVAIQDQGVGLSPEHLERLFTRFFRAQPDGPVPGTGLGLVIVKELMERMAGRIEVQSELGKGSQFTLWLRSDSASPQTATR